MIATQPLEVQLVSDVRRCRTCQWFWGGVLPYGNFPVFDWNEDYPAEVLDTSQTTVQNVARPWLKARAVGQAQVDPGVMHGCRKAPIMTVGINPNLTSYFASAQGGTWTFPKFSKDERYAYYYRHFTIWQESIDPVFLKQNVVEGSEIIAENDGWLLNATRSNSLRWLLLEIQYVGESKPRQIELAWTQEARFILFVNRSNKIDFANPGFRKDDIIGGKITGLEGENVQITEQSTGYYQRYLFVLNKFKEMAGAKLAGANLTIGEDVAQNDMVACASPGWSSKYDIPQDRIAHNCVQTHAWVVSQLVQSRPAVLVIVGGSSMDMFGATFGKYLNDLTYQYPVIQNGKTMMQDVEVFQLLKETCENEHFLHIKEGDYELKTRIVVTPHFSYGDNFLQQCRFSQAAWVAFEQDFVEDRNVLIAEGLVQDNDFNTIVPVRMTDADQLRIKPKITAAGWKVLMAYFYDPIAMMADVLAQELDAGRIRYDVTTKHLERAAGGCKFCVNDLWQFPEGCAYKKNEEPEPSQGSLEAVVRAITGS